MSDTKAIFNMFSRFNNSLKALDKNVPNTELVNTIINSLPRSQERKVIAILKANDLTLLKLEQLIRSLITYEMINSTNEKKKKNDLALIASTHENDDDDNEDEKELYFPLSSKGFLYNGVKV